MVGVLQESDAHTMADKFPSTVVNQHGLPEYIVSDCNSHFCGHFWHKLISLLDTILTFSTASQVDGIAEVKNYTMEHIL